MEQSVVLQNFYSNLDNKERIQPVECLSDIVRKLSVKHSMLVSQMDKSNVDVSILVQSQEINDIIVQLNNHIMKG